MAEHRIGVLGATSMVGQNLLPQLVNAGWHVEAFSRQTRIPGQHVNKDARVVFRLLEGSNYGHAAAAKGKITHWVCLAPIWVLPDYFSMLTAYQAKRVVALSSTSIFTKNTSHDPAEQNTADKLRNGEQRFSAWAEANRIEWMILRPTLIYGLGRDKNIVEIARFIRRFGFFPLFGQANGLRQPIHAADVAGACLAALQAPCAANRVYNISGGETLTYRNMVSRVFSALDRRPRLLAVPLWAFRLAVAMLRRLPRYRQWSTAMAERMNRDLVFDHADAVRDLGFKPRAFVLAAEDLPT